MEGSDVIETRSKYPEFSEVIKLHRLDDPMRECCTRCWLRILKFYDLMMADMAAAHCFKLKDQPKNSCG